MIKNDRDYMTMMFEQLLGQNKIILEAVGDMQDKLATFVTIDRFAQLEKKVDTIEFVVKDISRELREHGRRISTLEETVAG